MFASTWSCLFTVSVGLIMAGTVPEDTPDTKWWFTITWWSSDNKIPSHVSSPSNHTFPVTDDVGFSVTSTTSIPTVL